MQEIANQVRDHATLEQFQAWLAQFPPDADIGTPADACDCPMARYFQNVIGLPPLVKIDVDQSKIYLENVATREREIVFQGDWQYLSNTSVPIWITWLIEYIDDLPTQTSVLGKRIGVTAQTVREILDRVIARLNEPDSWNNH